MMRIKRPKSIDDLAFTVALTVASRTLLLCDRILRRVNKVKPEDRPHLEIARRDGRERRSAKSEFAGGIFTGAF